MDINAKEMDAHVDLESDEAIGTSNVGNDNKEVVDSNEETMYADMALSDDESGGEDDIKGGEDYIENTHDTDLYRFSRRSIPKRL